MLLTLPGTILLEVLYNLFYMADLNVQRKRRAPVWPWLLLILVIAAVAYFVMRDKGMVNSSSSSDSTTVQRADTANQYHMDTMRVDTSVR